MTTRERIIYESLKLFSIHGFDAVSTRMIARASEVSDTAMYKHFKGKQEIFDTIIDICKKRFQKETEKLDIHHICWKDVEDICLDLFRFQTQDEWIVMFRRVLVIEQFKNPEMGKLYKSFFIDLAVDCQTTIFTELIEQGYLRKKNPRVLAMELYAPFFMYHTIPGNSEHLLEELREHVTYFRETYRTELCDGIEVGLPENNK